VGALEGLNREIRVTAGPFVIELHDQIPVAIEPSDALTLRPGLQGLDCHADDGAPPLQPKVRRAPLRNS
jgi:hypothetical protein